MYAFGNACLSLPYIEGLAGGRGRCKEEEMRIGKGEEGGGKIGK